VSDARTIQEITNAEQHEEGKNSTMRESQHNNRTPHMLALIKKGDDAFNARDFATVDTVQGGHPSVN
jgi:hypothetical protein